MATARAKRASAWANTDGAVTLKHNPYQVAFLNALDQKHPTGEPFFNFLALFAGRRGGKTEIGAIAIPKLLARKPKQWGWVCAPTYRDLHDVVIPLVLSRIPAEWIVDWSAEHLTLLISNGSRLQFRSLENPNTARGPGLDFAWIDEARSIAQLAWHTMMPALADKNGVAIVTTSPNGYDWTYNDFWKMAADGVPGYWACKYPTNINPKMQEPAQRALMAIHKATMDPLFYRQEYEADFVTFAGAVYGNQVGPHVLFHNDDQVRDWIPTWPIVPEDFPVFLGIDPGADHPFAVVFLVATPRGLVQVDEYNERHRSLQEHWHHITQKLTALNPQRPPAPALMAIDRSQRQTIIEFHHGMNLQMSPAENNLTAGIRRVGTWFGSGFLRIVVARCPKTYAQLQSYRWNDAVTNKGELREERVIKVDDDLPDALRYALMTWHETPFDYEEKLAAVLHSDASAFGWEKARMQRIREAMGAIIEQGDTAFATPGWAAEPSDYGDFSGGGGMGVEFWQ